MNTRTGWIGIALCCMVFGQIAFAGTVRLVPTSQYPDIQTAVNGAASGDTIQLLNGVFTGPRNSGITITNKSLTFASASHEPAKCIIDCTRAYIVDIHNSINLPVLFADITFRNGSVNVTGCGVNVTNCVFEPAKLSLSDCVMEVRDCTFRGEPYAAVGGQRCQGSIIHCLFDGNGSGVEMEACHELAVILCEFTGQTGLGLKQVGDGSTDGQIHITDCTFTDNSGGLQADTNVKIERCEFLRNLWYGGAIVQNGSTLIDCHFEGNVEYFGNSGGGLLASGDTNLSRCSFIGNTAPETGGGVMLYTGSHQVTDCTFQGNSSLYNAGLSRISVNNDETFLMENCVFEDNVAAEGGGAGISSTGSAIIRNCRILNNTATARGGGLYLSGNILVENCRIEGNRATWRGGGIYGGDFNPNLLFLNCLITSNEAAKGGGAYFEDGLMYGSAWVVACTLYGNTATESGGALQTSYANVQLTTCIVWNNAAPQNSQIGHDDPDLIPVVTYSDVQGGYPGMFNISADPVFVDTAGGDFHLQTASPCIDLGEPVLPLFAPLDIEGNPRVFGTAPDMGAYEVQSTPTASISGRVVLENMLPSAARQMVTFTFLPMDSPDPILLTVPIGTDGVFLIPDLRRTDYALRIKGTKWLSVTVPVFAAGGGVQPVNVTLRAGDANDDNSIDVFDLDKLILSFDADPNSPNWNGGIADFNCDNSVDVLDLDVLIRNFDSVGDE